MRCLYILEINPLSVASFSVFFSPFCGFFVLLMVSFAMQKLSSLIMFLLFIFIFITLGGGSKKRLLWFMSVFCLCFSLKSLKVSTLTLMSLIHFEFIFVRLFSFHYFTCSISDFPAKLIEEIVFSSLYILASFVVD